MILHLSNCSEEQNENEFCRNLDEKTKALELKSECFFIEETKNTTSLHS